jgi:hypothetical protein
MRTVVGIMYQTTCQSVGQLNVNQRCVWLAANDPLN